MTTQFETQLTEALSNLSISLPSNVLTTEAGNAISATKAINDGNNRNIVDTYAEKSNVVSSFNGATGAVTFTAPVTSVNGQTGAVTIPTAPSPKAYITETWQSGENWYRVWSDGLIEQLIVKTIPNQGESLLVDINLLKPYTKCICHVNWFLETHEQWHHTSGTNDVTSTFTIMNSDQTFNYSVEVKRITSDFPKLPKNVFQTYLPRYKNSSFTTYPDPNLKYYFYIICF